MSDGVVEVSPALNKDGFSVERLAQVKSAWLSSIIQCCREALAPLERSRHDAQLQPPLPLNTQAEIQIAFETRFYATVSREELQSMARRHAATTMPRTEASVIANDKIEVIVNRFLFDYLRVDESLNRELAKCTFYQDVIKRLRVAGEKSSSIQRSIEEADNELNVRTKKFNELEAGLRSHVTVIELSDSDDGDGSDSDVVIVEDSSAPTVVEQRREVANRKSIHVLTVDGDSDGDDVVIVDGPSPSPLLAQSTRSTSSTEAKSTATAAATATSTGEVSASSLIPPANKVRRLDNAESASTGTSTSTATATATATPMAAAMANANYGASRRVVLTAPVKLVPIENMKNLITTDLLDRPAKVQVGDAVLALRDQDEWCRAIVMHELQNDAYIVQFNWATASTQQQQQQQQQRTLPAVQLAMGESCLVRRERCPVGTRVVSTVADPDYADEGPDAEAEGEEAPRYAGIVAESPGEANKFRYLVFFDDGYCQYSEQAAVHRVLAQSVHNWRLAGPDSRFFIRDYLDAYPTRDLLRLQPGQTVVAELLGEWCNARVEAVDNALIRITFVKDGSCEWVYRGSTRLRTLYERIYGPPKQPTQPAKKLRISSAAVVASQVRVGHARKSTSASRLASAGSAARRPTVAADDSSGAPEATSRGPGRPRRRRDDEADDEDDVAYRGRQVATFDAAASPTPQPRPYRPHRCSPACCADDDVEDAGADVVAYDHPAARGRNPLEAPVALGWWRLLVQPATGEEDGDRSASGREVVEYRAPCGRSLRSHADLDAYLRETRCRLHVSAFCFDAAVRINNEFQPIKIIYQLRDISYGKEPVPVSAVNSLDNTSLPYIEYAANRVPTNGVATNESEPGFLVCCDCTDDCSDRRRCACQQLTIRSSQAITGRADIRITYRHGRHMSRALGGIYECNSKCRCRLATCRNRVVQHGLRNRLQVFRTARKGWGIRTLHDIPKGAFVCIYAGEVYNEESAVRFGTELGDEYQAELDLIEIMQMEKEGYERMAREPDQDDAASSSSAPVDLRSSWFGESHPYVMDAKQRGNLGRYMNHSCEPNCRVQSVFVRTHDPRFPETAFFALRRISAGEELCWDYNYEVGSVAGKELLCYCSTPSCRVRLL